MPQAFSTLSLSQEMIDNLNQLNYTEMTPVQEESLPPILERMDIMAQAKTGSGKTAAFGIGLLHHLDVKELKVQAAVICPTRELSEQVANELRRLARFTSNIKILTLVGGEAVYPQKVALEKGVHIIVGTPGRIMDTITKGHLDLANVKTLVLDEADRMLDMGFHDDIAAIIKFTPKHRQTLLFSATYEDETKRLSKKFQLQPEFIHITSDADETTIRQSFYTVHEDDKVELIDGLMAQAELESCIIFCNMKLTCDEVAKELHYRGYDVASLHADLDQKERNEVLTMFSNKSLNVLVATDVASRGLDIKELPAVFNYDIPHQAEIYVHRIGRTGRMGQEGLAYTFVGAKEGKFVEAISKYTEERITLKSPPDLNSNKKFTRTAPMKTLKILAGKKDKLRAGDFVGALGGILGFKGDDVGSISVVDRFSYIAIKKELMNKVELKDDRLRVKKKNYRYIKL
ncbi:ATP-dependent RNA helicase DbpA [Sulfurimonas sp. MAG313]|nr:ATP-dependent RNA helicase DbpA [Sulfurimonas sp. MAG313]MDF1880533.1 ATP-dependent RNA helicase DbpA [Sulfurimonas sp. MAG313]